MYSEPGKYACDFCIIENAGKYHLFHIRGNRGVFGGPHNNGSEEDLGHAISDDMVNWKHMQVVLARGPSGAFDESVVAAPHIIVKDGIYYMFYTGFNRFNAQKIGLAVSSDLNIWEKSIRNPLFHPGDWADWDEKRASACRDAMIFEDGLRYIMYYTATRKDGRACIGTAVSKNLIDWADNGYTYVEEDSEYNRLESPFVLRKNGLYYLFYSGKGSGRVHWEISYLVSKTPLGPWKKPDNHILLEKWACASEHPTFNGKTFFFYIMYEFVMGDFNRGKVSDPVETIWLDDGTVRMKEYIPANAKRLNEPLTSLASYDLLCDPWQKKIISLQDGFEISNDHWISEQGYFENITYECTFSLKGPASEGGISFRLDEMGNSGYIIRLVRNGALIQFLRKLSNGREEIIQERNLSPVSFAEHKIKVVTRDEFFEIYLDDYLCIVRADYSYKDGYVGVIAQGTCFFRKPLLFLHD